MDSSNSVLTDAKLKPSDVDKVLLVGGSTRIPAVQDAVRNFMGKEPFKGINPDECVAIGAAVQAAVLGKEEGVKDVLLCDVTPLSLGIETLGGAFTRIINKNTTIPCKQSQTFTTAADNQTQVGIHVLQGEREMASGNKTLGTFELDGIAPARRGIPQIEVTFDIDSNGIVSVSAKDKGTGREQHITITSSANMSQEDIDRAVKEAEQFAEEDKRMKEAIETKNNADQMIYQSEKTLEEVGDKLPEEDKADVKAALEKLRETVKGNDTAAIKADTEALTQAFYKLSEKLYSAQGASGADASGQQPGGFGTAQGDGQDNGGDYYNADFEDKT